MSVTELIQQTKNYVLESLNGIIKMIEETEPIKNAEDLRKSELEIVAETDRIAGKLMETVLKKAITSACVEDEAKVLVKSNPTRMKNHGKRDVTIHPYRGDTFTVKVTYYCRAGLSEKQGKKRGPVFILS